MATGARYQITVDGKPRSNLDDKAIALKAAAYLKYKNPHGRYTAAARRRMFRGYRFQDGVAGRA
jgi:hypothetical protein